MGHWRKSTAMDTLKKEHTEIGTDSGTQAQTLGCPSLPLGHSHSYCEILTVGLLTSHGDPDIGMVTLRQ